MATTPIEVATKIAKRSSIRTHKTGAIIVQRRTVIGMGWSHIPVGRLVQTRSIHAEMHALARCRHMDLRNATCYVATISGKSGNVANSKPCYNCAIALISLGFKEVVFTTRNGVTVMSRGEIVEELSRLKVYDNNSK